MRRKSMMEIPNFGKRPWEYEDEDTWGVLTEGET